MKMRLWGGGGSVYSVCKTLAHLFVEYLTRFKATFKLETFNKWDYYRLEIGGFTHF